MFLGYFALCDLVPASPTSKSLTLSRSVNVLVYTEYVSRTCLVTSTAPTVMLFFLESLHIPEFSDFGPGPQTLKLGKSGCVVRTFFFVL